MAEPFLSEIRMTSFDFAPKGWALCNGQTLPINQNQALFSLLGTTFGGNGQTNFQLPNLQGKTPIHVGSGHTLGQTGGEQAHTPTHNEMTTHPHTLNATSHNATLDQPAGPLLASAANQYAAPPVSTTLVPSSIGNTGGSQPHLNMQPYLTISFSIALQGIFPSPN